MIKHEMTTPDDLVEVFQYLSNLHRTEVANFCEITGMGWRDFQNAIASWVDMFGGFTLRDEHGRVLAVWSARPMGFAKPAPSVVERTGVFLLCSRAFFDKTGRNLREVKRILRQTRKVGEIVTVVSYSRHPKAVRWAKFLGFQHVVEDSGGLRFTCA